MANSTEIAMGVSSRAPDPVFGMVVGLVLGALLATASGVAFSEFDADD